MVPGLLHARDQLLSEDLVETIGQLLVCPNARNVCRTDTWVLDLLGDRQTLSCFGPSDSGPMDQGVSEAVRLLRM